MKKLLELLLKKAGPEPISVDKANASADLVCILSFEKLEATYVNQKL